MRLWAIGLLVLTACGGGRDRTPQGPLPDGGRVDAGPTDGGVLRDGRIVDGGESDARPACEGIPLVEDGVLDFDLPVQARVELQGAVTVDGTAHAESEARLHFESLEHELTVSALITGGAYRLNLPASRYAIYYRTSTCDDTRVPCTDGLLVADQNVTADGVLDINIPTALISGRVSLNDGAFPAGSMELSFAAGDLGGRVPIRDSRYEIRVIDGSYSVSYFNPDLRRCRADEGAFFPCDSGDLLPAMELREDGVLDVRVPMVIVSGAITQDGAQMPDAPGNRGRVCFGRDAFEDVVCAEDFNRSGPARYRFPLLGGTYAQHFVPDSRRCNDGESPVPCAGIASRNVDINTDGVLDLDYRSVQITGEVKAGGATLLDESHERGSLTWIPAVGPQVTISEFRSVGPARYSLHAIAGDYSVRFEADSSSCARGSVPQGVPCFDATLLDSQSLETDGVLDFELPTAMVSGRVTVDGEPAAGATVVFKHEGITGTIVADEGGNYRARVYHSTYDIGIAGECEASAILPCSSGVLREGVEIASDGVVDLEAQVVTITGRVTLAGAEVPSAVQHRGLISFDEPEQSTLAPPAFDARGPTSYSVRLLRGNYAARFSGNPELCTEDTPIPCYLVDLAGCP